MALETGVPDTCIRRQSGLPLRPLAAKRQHVTPIVQRHVTFRFSNLFGVFVCDWTSCPGRLPIPFCGNSFRQRYKRKGTIPNSRACPETFLRSNLSMAAFSFHALSKCILCFLTLHKNKLLCLTFCPSKVSNSTRNVSIQQILELIHWPPCRI